MESGGAAAARRHRHAHGRQLLAQAVGADGNGALDQLVFQANFAPGEAREFLLSRAALRKATREEYRVYGRFVRERHDDFAWENDRVGFRLYGEALESFEKEPLTSSAVDAWSKRTRRLVLNDWYLVDDYHRDHGERGDFYPAGRSCGGSGLVLDGTLVVSKNFRSSRVLASGPIRLVFEVSYPAWGKPGLRVSETRRWLGCGVVVDPAAIVDVSEQAGNQLVVMRTPRGPARELVGRLRLGRERRLQGRRGLGPLSRRVRGPVALAARAGAAAMRRSIPGGMS